MYDIFYVSSEAGSDQEWNLIKNKYPAAQRLSYITSFDQIKKKAFTNTFWVVWENLELLDSFDLNSYRVTKWDNEYVHVFKSGSFFDGICLFPKALEVTQREFENRFFVKKKEVDIVASNRKPFDRFNIFSYEDYEKALTESKTELFWAIWPDTTPSQDFKFDYDVPYYNSKVPHVFRHGSHFDGICLLPKCKKISQREIEYRFFTEKKEVDILASHRKPFDRFNISSYDEYTQAVNDSTTEMFWAIWPDTTPSQDFKFDYEVPRCNTKIPHIFKNGKYYDGICLLPKSKVFSQREFEYRFFAEKKEIDIVASVRKPFDRFNISSYDDYTQAVNDSTTEMFWAIWPDTVIREDFKFDYEVPWHNNKLPHVFKNGEYYDGICLLPKRKTISQREFEYRFFTEKKEVDIIASDPAEATYDIVFISYNEPTADENFENLKSKYSRAKRVHGVKGIHQAHIEAAKLATTDLFYVVDGDAIIVDEFKFDHIVAKYEKHHVHVWRSRNPVNDLEYGYGGVKLLPRQLTLDMDVSKPDMTTSISKNFKEMNTVSNLTSFNTDAFNTWKSAFRECVKLSSKIIERQVNSESEERLETWCSVGNDRPYGEYAIKGALMGKEFGIKNKNNHDELNKINDFDWLKGQFDAL